MFTTFSATSVKVPVILHSHQHKHHRAALLLANLINERHLVRLRIFFTPLLQAILFFLFKFPTYVLCSLLDCLSFSLLIYRFLRYTFIPYLSYAANMLSRFVLWLMVFCFVLLFRTFWFLETQISLFFSPSKLYVIFLRLFHPQIMKQSPKFSSNSFIIFLHINISLFPKFTLI